MTKEYQDAVATIGSILRIPEEILPLGEGRSATTALAEQMEGTHAALTGERWGWSADQNATNWVGSFISREAAIQDAREHSWKTFYVISGLIPDAKGYMPDADTIVDMIASAASDAAGEAAEEFPDVSPEAVKELDAMLASWAAKHLSTCSFWISNGECEKIEDGVTA